MEDFVHSYLHLHKEHTGFPGEGGQNVFGKYDTLFDKYDISIHRNYNFRYDIQHYY